MDIGSKPSMIASWCTVFANAIWLPEHASMVVNEGKKYEQELLEKPENLSNVATGYQFQFWKGRQEQVVRGSRGFARLRVIRRTACCACLLLTDLSELQRVSLDLSEIWRQSVSTSAMSKRAMETWLEGRTDATMICGDSERLPLSIWTFRNAVPSLSYRPRVWSEP